MKKFLLILSVVTLCASCAKREKTETLTVASERAIDQSVPGQECFLVKHDGQQDWELWCFDIEGFDYQPGYEYVIRIKEKQEPGIALRKYELVNEVSKVMKESEKMPENLIHRASDEIKKIRDEAGEKIDEITDKVKDEIKKN